MIRTIEMFGQEVEIEQDFSFAHAGCVFDAALVLAKYFENAEKFPAGYFLNKTVLELGSGTGFIGIILAMLGAKVTVSDKKELIPLMERNIARNQKFMKNPMKTTEILWGETPITEKYDFVVASDCIYENEELWRLFAATLKECCIKNDYNTEIILSHELRGKKDLNFWNTIPELGFTFRKVLLQDLDEHWQSPDIGVFHVQLHQQ